MVKNYTIEFYKQHGKDERFFLIISLGFILTHRIHIKVCSVSEFFLDLREGKIDNTKSLILSNVSDLNGDLPHGL